ncbi:MAG: 23S rRNA (pseudouridine(1915)-N(3))-methyltransferase RlmH [Pseudomonadota bacterium]
MRLTVCAVGKLRAGPETTLINDYAGRIAASGRSVGYSGFAIKEVEAPRGLEGLPRQERESDLLLAAAPDGGRRIALDERGKNLTSTAFAKMLSQWRDDGVGDAAFLIGGADGHADKTRNQADFLLSLGKATWPHALARVMLCEQIYRAITISTGHPYHRA